MIDDEKKQIREDIRNYQWIMKEYKRISELIEDDEVESSNQLMSIQNIKAFESKSQSDKRLHKLKMRYGDKLETIHDMMNSVDNDRDYAVIHCATDGMNVTDISSHLGISRRTVYRILDDIADQAIKQQY